MRRVITAITVAASASALFLAAPQLASAAAPSNDTSAGATVVSALPYNQTEDTTQATTDAEDAALNANCGAPATEASVWFTYTSPTDDTLIADVSASNYSAGLIVATGTPGNLSIQDCGPQELVESISAGQQLYFMAFDDTVGNGVGGTLQISISSAPPPPSFTVTVNSVGHFNSRTGVATISGTSTCTGGDSIDIETDLRQRVGRLV
ncbi:MAG TPA: hypothetical protein VJ831_00765, partial [Jatrophihabitantaceae bacterium]|nr:hypothetical protein [Jatrophihabitantaceae bacterium]